MIGRLTGKLAIKRAPQLLIDCQGVGYEVDVSMSTFYQLPEEGQAVSLWTHLLIKDDQHALIGFYSDHERTLFRQLIRINGVGPKMALTILSGISESDFVVCIQSSDVPTLTRLPGVGKKTAERLIMEMRDKLEGLGQEVSATAPGIQPLAGQGSVQNEALEALQSLGYKATDASRMIKTIATESADLSAEDIIRKALQNAIS